MLGEDVVERGRNDEYDRPVDVPAVPYRVDAGDGADKQIAGDEHVHVNGDVNHRVTVHRLVEPGRIEQP
jgi:hypothetical protein